MSRRQSDVSHLFPVARKLERSTKTRLAEFRGVSAMLFADYVGHLDGLEGLRGELGELMPLLVDQLLEVGKKYDCGDLCMEIFFVTSRTEINAWYIKYNKIKSNIESIRLSLFA